MNNFFEKQRNKDHDNLNIDSKKNNSKLDINQNEENNQTNNYNIFKSNNLSKESQIKQTSLNDCSVQIENFGNNKVEEKHSKKKIIIKQRTLEPLLPQPPPPSSLSKLSATDFLTVSNTSLLTTSPNNQRLHALALRARSAEIPLYANYDATSENNCVNICDRNLIQNKSDELQYSSFDAVTHEKRTNSFANQLSNTSFDSSKWPSISNSRRRKLPSTERFEKPHVALSATASLSVKNISAGVFSSLNNHFEGIQVNFKFIFIILKLHTFIYIYYT